MSDMFATARLTFNEAMNEVVTQYAEVFAPHTPKAHHVHETLNMLALIYPDAVEGESTGYLYQLFVTKYEEVMRTAVIDQEADAYANMIANDLDMSVHQLDEEQRAAIAKKFRLIIGVYHDKLRAHGWDGES